MDQHKIGQWINLALAALLVVGIALTVYAVMQVRDLNSEAKGKPSTTSAIVRVSPNPGLVGTEQVYTVTGSGFSRRITSVNIAAYGETNWLTQDGVLATATVSGGSFTTTFTRSFIYTGEVIIQVREPYTGSLTAGNMTVPPVLAKTTLLIQ